MPVFNPSRPQAVLVLIWFTVLLLFQPDYNWSQTGQETDSSPDSIADLKDSFIYEEQKFHVALPVWVPGFRGSFAYGGISLYPENGDQGLGDRITDRELKVEFYLIGQLEFYYRGFFIQADGFNATLGSSLVFYDRELLEIEGTINGTIVRGLAGYKVFTKVDRDRSFQWSVSPYAGARYYKLHLFTKRENLLNIRPSWTDPIVGVMVPVGFKRWMFRGQADFGGFGIQNRRSWFVNAQAAYRFSKLFSLGAGWAFLDFESDKEVDLRTLMLGMQLSGPTLNIRFSF